MAIAKGFSRSNKRVEPKSFMPLVKHHNVSVQLSSPLENANT